MITTTKAIILRCIDYQDSSKILTVLSQTHGKISLIAKGAKRPKSKFAGSLEVGNILEVTYYYKSSRGVQTLSEVSIDYQSLEFRKDFERASILYSSLELITQLIHENEENQDFFAFSYNLIKWLGETETVSPSVLPYVQIRLAQLLGVGLINAINNLETVYLNISSGEVSEQPDSELAYKLSDAQALFIQRVLTTQSKEIFNIQLNDSELKQLVHHLDVYFKYHVEGFKDRRSDSIFQKMIQD